MPDRIQLYRAKGWRKPEGAVVVSRGPGKFGNPFTVQAAIEAGYPDPARMAVTAYRDWLNGDPWACPFGTDWAERRQIILDALPTLRGHDLCCWCRLDQPCHADVLLEMVNA
jgi:hypothetical protein